MQSKRIVMVAFASCLVAALAIGLWVGLRWIAPISMPGYDKSVVIASSPSASSIVTMRLNSSSAALKPNEFRHFDWALALAVSNGGLIERVNAFDFQAPEPGYLPEVEIQMTSDANPRGSSRINKDYFVHFADGRYGRFQITVSGETGFCRFESYLNPSGSRNLEVDPAKLVRATSSP